jgi:hypothetical protein
MTVVWQIFSKSSWCWFARRQSYSECFRWWELISFSHLATARYDGRAAYGDAETKRQALENGTEALLTKPIDFKTLGSKIDMRIERAAQPSRICSVREAALGSSRHFRDDVEFGRYRGRSGHRSSAVCEYAAQLFVSVHRLEPNHRPALVLNFAILVAVGAAAIARLLMH